MKFALIVASLCACTAPTDRDYPTVVVQKGTFELDGSKCRLFEVSQKPRGSWDVEQRFSLCYPPLVGMLPGSKPGTGREPNIP